MGENRCFRPCFRRFSLKAVPVARPTQPGLLCAHPNPNGLVSLSPIHPVAIRCASTPGPGNETSGPEVAGSVQNSTLGPVGSGGRTDVDPSDALRDAAGARESPDGTVAQPEVVAGAPGCRTRTPYPRPPAPAMMQNSSRNRTFPPDVRPGTDAGNGLQNRKEEAACRNAQISTR